MKDFIKKLFGSLDNTSLGYSGRKLSALAGVITGIYITAYKVPATDQITALYCWLGFALLCLGIITVQQIIDFKNGKSAAAQ